jgi:signal transduction histidine kinase
MSADAVTALRSWSRTLSVRTLLTAVGYFALYLLLDWASYVEPLHNTSFTPWNPNTGLAMAFLLRSGGVGAPLVALSIFVGELLTDAVPVPWGVLGLTSVYVTAIYSAAGWLLRRKALAPPLTTPRGAAWFAAVMAVAAGTAAVGYSGVHVAAGELRSEEFWASGLRLWIGDFNGIIALVPLLALPTPWRALRERARHGRRQVDVHRACLALALDVAFAVAAARDIRLFYPLFAPVTWMALRYGVGGAMLSVSLVQAALVAALKFTPGPVSIFDMQFPLLSLGLTALFLGALATQHDTILRTLREQESALQRSIRFAAAGELASALTHELNQPMTALVSYVRASELMAGNGSDVDPRLGATLQKATQEAARATGVLRRLREFYRGEGPHLEPTDALAVCAHVAEALQDRMRRAAIEFELRRDGAVRTAMTDRTQLEIVIYNLLTNAVDALGEPGAHGARRRRIELSAAADARGVRLMVDDSGPGVTTELAARLFEPFVTDKSSGMGLGLALSRSFLRHQGGDLWYEPGHLGGARFIILLAHVENGVRHDA